MQKIMATLGPSKGSSDTERTGLLARVASLQRMQDHIIVYLKALEAAGER
jgi:hypothetical protein